MLLTLILLLMHKHLKTSGNDIDYVPPGFFENITNLTVLDFGDNHLSTLVHQASEAEYSRRRNLLGGDANTSTISIFHSLTKLKKLWVDTNHLDGVLANESLQGPVFLEYLDLSYNTISLWNFNNTGSRLVAVNGGSSAFSWTPELMQLYLRGVYS